MNSLVNTFYVCYIDYDLFVFDIVRRETQEMGTPLQFRLQRYTVSNFRFFVFSFFLLSHHFARSFLLKKRKKKEKKEKAEKGLRDDRVINFMQHNRFTK